MKVKGEAWEGRDGNKGGGEDGSEGRAWQARDTGKQRSSSDFYRTKFTLMPQWMDASCYPDLNKLVYEEFKVNEVKKVERRRNAKRIV
jgi:hypothetical protein